VGQAPHTIDLRSDTVTVPTPEMLAAMMAAEVGDDVFGDDPTVNRLEAMAAEMLGKEAALFVASGTMGNLVALKTHTQPGDEVILEAHSHTYNYEGGGYAAVCGASVRPIEAERGILRPAQIEAALRPDDQHFARSRLAAIENTHNSGGGAVWTLEEVAAVSDFCRDRGLALHMDGARLFNACVAAGVGAGEYARHVDSVTFCLSKGLGCPVGSVLCGSAEFIARARRVRKMLGGGMRQAGYLAAAGVYALEHNIERLAEDHANARLLAEGVRDCAQLRLTYDPPETNMVYIEMPGEMTAGQFEQRLAAEGILTLAHGSSVRAVTHIGITRPDVERVVGVLKTHFG
jgi:threonine aldolase